MTKRVCAQVDGSETARQASAASGLPGGAMRRLIPVMLAVVVGAVTLTTAAEDQVLGQVLSQRKAGGRYAGPPPVNLANPMDAIAADGPAFADFQQRAEAWRLQPQKPPIPEQARRFDVLAKDAVQNKDFPRAVNYYEQGLQLWPLWPEAQFNVAQIYGEVGNYAPAVMHMKRYLALCPYADDAQAAKDKMYIWEERGRQAYAQAQAQAQASVANSVPPPQPCFIATAAYGTPSEIHVATLRDFRAHYLVAHAPGRWFVTQYNHFSPPIADMIRTRPWARWMVRTALGPVVIGAGAALGNPADIALVAAGLIVPVLGAYLYQRRRQRRRVRANA
jgi:hypothetical protein